MIRTFWLSGSVALTFLLGTLVLAAPASAIEYPCEPLGAGTQAYAQCMVRAEDREAAPIIPPAQLRKQAPAGEQAQVPLPAPVVEESSTSVWTLALAGVIGAAVAIGGAFGVSRFGQRQRATAH